MPPWSCYVYPLPEQGFKPAESIERGCDVKSWFGLRNVSTIYNFLNLNNLKTLLKRWSVLKVLLWLDLPQSSIFRFVNVSEKDFDMVCPAFHKCDVSQRLLCFAGFPCQIWFTKPLWCRSFDWWSDLGWNEKEYWVFGIQMPPVVLCSSAMQLYPVARIYLNTEAFASLRGLRSVAFQTIALTKLIPHAS